ncbi:hypothetical protein [Fodinicola acaciae]|uniref:hypothetical protein n=1 Tax=Fodinicola acaciae TaxID=2681555 RepID=UPI001FE822A8|nr:hypothetical protein [Fodinicola acaciae]
MPVRDVTDTGVLDLGRDGYAALAAAGTVNFALRTADEQAALVAGFGSWLNTLDGPAQIVVRTHRADLATLADRITDIAPALPHPALESAARSHADFIRDLSDRHELLHRGVLIAVRQPESGAHAAARAAHAIERTTHALAGCGITASVLDGPTAQWVIADTADPYRDDYDDPTAEASYAPPDAIITAAGRLAPTWTTTEGPS